ncbi:hypothetical protein BC835DRAFT_1413619 [Cytidiella melzeri]|nr:hypothetical protein BC835DRAFT_1413619 [Cytidiella melzeri]
MADDDLVFTYKVKDKEIKKTLKASERKSSREAIGIWKVDSKAWKVYGTTNKYQALSDDYRRAAVAAGLPMGDPSFQQGKVKDGKKAETQGFVLITQWMEGTNFQKTSSSFKAALTKEKLSKDKTTNDYKRTKSGCDAANTVGLKDCQGFIKPGINEPLRFIDIHTSWNPQTSKFGHIHDYAMADDDLVFTYKVNDKEVKKTLKASERKSSREAIGIWKVDSKAWKVYGTTNKYEALSDDYRRADVVAGLPMGHHEFKQGKVKDGQKTQTEGFVLITDWMEGTNFQKTSSSFKAALTKEKLSKDKTTDDYKRCAGFLHLISSHLIICPPYLNLSYVDAFYHRTGSGCDAANTVGLKDCQGFIKPGINEPLRFIDIHTSWNSQTKKFGHSGLAAELVEVITAW